MNRFSHTFTDKLDFFRLVVTAVFFSSAFCYGQGSFVDSLIHELPNNSGEAKVLLLSDISYYLSPEDAEKSLEYAQQCLTLAKKTGNQDLIAEGYNAKAISYYAHGDYHLALKSNLEALKIRKKKGDPRALISSYNKIANCYHDLGNYKQAIEYNLKALKLSEDNDFVAYQGMILNNIGEIYKAQRKFKSAIKYYEQAITLAKKTHDTIPWAKALNNAGVSYREIGQPEKSEKFYAQGLRMIQGQKIYDLEGALLLNLGVLASQRGQDDEAFAYYRSAWKLLDGSGDRHGLSVAYNNLGNTYLKMGELDSSLFFFEKGNEIAKQINLKTQLEDSYLGLSQYYKTTNNYRKAYYYDSLASEIKDELLNTENARVLEELNLKYDTEKNKKKIAEQKLLVEESNSRFKTIILGFLIFLLIVSAATIYAVQRQKRLKRDIELQQERAKSQLQEEKLRISRELHDNIGSQLTLFKSNLESIQSRNESVLISEKLNNLSDQAKFTIQQLREAIWTIQSDEVTFTELMGKVAGFVQQINRDKMEFVVEDKLTESRRESILLPLQAIAIFRVVQEAINNSIKHSASKRVVITFNDNQISIEDFGKGFDKDAAEMGYGLVNMQARMEENGYLMTVETELGNGTKVSINL